MSPPVLIVGGEGLLGTALREHARRAGGPVWATLQHLPEPGVPELEQLDLTEPLDTWTPPPCPAAILCAAIPSLETCRRDPAGTRHVNVTQTVRLAERLRAAGVFVVFPSTNLVFDGTLPGRRAHDPVCPQTEYGRQKAEVEAALATFGPWAAIVRLTKVVSPHWALLRNWTAALQAGQPVRAFADLGCAPIPLDLTARGLLEVARRRLPGLWQFSAETDVAYADLARHLARRLSGDPALVEEISAQATGELEHVPRHTTLDTTGARRELGLEFPEPFAVFDAALRP